LSFALASWRKSAILRASTRLAEKAKLQIVAVSFDWFQLLLTSMPARWAAKGFIHWKGELN